MNREQFCNFLCHLWNSSEYQSWAESDELFWESIAKFELARRFDKGWPYCHSTLQIGPGGYRWEYTTTSGTQMLAGRSLLGYGNDLPNTEFSVKVHGNSHQVAHCLQLAMDDVPYLTWHEMYYSQKGSKNYDVALAYGIVPECDLQV